MGKENFSSILHWAYPKGNRGNCEVRQDSELGDPYISLWDTNELGIKPTFVAIMAREREWEDSKIAEKATLDAEFKTLETFMASRNLTKRALKEFLK